MPTAAEPDVAVVRPAHDVMLVGGSIFVHADVPIDVRAMVAATVMTSAVMTSAVMTSAVMASAMVAAAVMASAPAVVTSAMAATVAFRIRRRHDSNSERRSDRKNKTNFLQHFCCPRLAWDHHCGHKLVNAH
jgi:membrane protein implicated in regulation of membrane protease activity